MRASMSYHEHLPAIKIVPVQAISLGTDGDGFRQVWIDIRQGADEFTVFAGKREEALALASSLWGAAEALMAILNVDEVPAP